MIVDSIIYGLTNIEVGQVITHNFLRSDLAQKQWLCSIDGLCPTYGFKRSFVNSKKSKAHHFMIVKYTYLLEFHKVYEYRNFLVDDKEKLFSSGYFAITPSGVIELENEQIRSVLRMPVKSWGVVKKKDLSDEGGEYAREDLPF